MDANLPGGQQLPDTLLELDSVPPPSDLPAAAPLPALPPSHAAESSSVKLPFVRSYPGHSFTTSGTSAEPKNLTQISNTPFLAADHFATVNMSSTANNLAGNPSALFAGSTAHGNTVPPAISKGGVSVFSLLKDRYRADKNRNRILDVIQLYLHQNGKASAINETPLINGKIIDLSTLFLAIAGQGGFAKVDPITGWTDLASKMGYNIPGVIETAGAILREVYSKIFLNFEIQLSSKKVQAQQSQQANGLVNRAAAANATGAKPLSAAGVSSSSFVSNLSSQGQSIRDFGKAPKKRDRLQAQMEVSGCTDSGIATDAVSVAVEKSHETPAFSFNKNASDKGLMAECIADLSSKDGAAVVRGLNTLTLRTAEFEARGLSLEPYPDVIIALGELLDLANPIVVPFFEKAVKDQHFNAIQRERFGINWDVRSSVYGVECLDDNAVLLTCLNILRNISFEVVNEVLLAHSSKIILHIIFLLMAPVYSDKLMPECVAYAFDILTNIGKTIDLSGRKRKFQKDNWMLDSIDDDDCDSIKARCTSHYSIQSSDLYTVATHAVFPRLYYFMKSYNRDYVIKAIDCFGHLVQAEENVELLNNCPESLPCILIELLCVNITTAEVSLPPSFIHNDLDELRARPEPVMGLFADQSDITTRDTTLYAIYMLVCLSSKWRRWIPTIPMALDIIRKISMALPRTESSSRAQQILSVLCMDPYNKTEFLRIQRDMCVSACSDEVISDLIFSAMGYNFYTNDSISVNSAGNSAGQSVIPRIRWG